MENPIELIQDHGIEFLGRYYSVYRGIVISNEDPQYIGRIKVKVPSVLNGIEVWASPLSMVGGSNYGIKKPIPELAEIVWVWFEKGDPMLALWDHFNWSPDEVPEEFKNNHVVGIITPRGNKVYIDENDSQGTLKVFVNERIRVNIIDSDISLELTKDGIIANGGTNLGIMNLSEFQNFLQALVQDLSMVGSGSQVTKWMGEGMKNLEDKKFLH